MSPIQNPSPRRWRIRMAALSLLMGLSLPLTTSAQDPVGTPPAVAEPETFVLPSSVPDPIEPFNRVMWSFNKGLMTGIVKPAGKVYRFVVVKPVRTGIGNFGRNLTYPVRLLNNLLQGKWRGARNESDRFFCNTIIGVGGFFDVATKWNIPKSDADFGQTLGHWGWQPHFYLMLPLFGPSNERDALGLAADTAANPLVYISPYELVARDPLTYLGPYTYFTYVVRCNELSDSVNEYVRFSQAEMDPYAQLQYAWTFARANEVADFQVQGEKDEASLETLESVFFTYKDPAFLDHAKTRSVLIPTTGRKLKYTCWMQPGKAAVVYLVPGMGSHRLALPSLGLAELAYQNGFSVVCVSSASHSEFMTQASTAAMPAYLPADGHDLQVALTAIDRNLHTQYPGRLGDKALMGYSMGAIQSLFLAATAPTDEPPLVQFDRYVAINTPVSMMHGLAKLDEFYRAPLEWSGDERTANIENTFLKVAALSKSTLTPHTSLPFNAIESKFLIGLTFRLILRDVIFNSQQRNNTGVLQQSMDKYRREPVYQEILQNSYRDYFDKFAVPYYQTRGVASPAADALARGGDLRTYEAGLRANPKVRVIVNQNDFLLSDEDLAWLVATFPPEQLTVFVKGGHLGNLSNPSVQRAILKALGGLQASASAAQ